MSTHFPFLWFEQGEGYTSFDQLIVMEIWVYLSFFFWYRRITKWLLHLATGSCELQRICYKIQQGAGRTKQVGRLWYLLASHAHLSPLWSRVSGPFLGIDYLWVCLMCCPLSCHKGIMVLWFSSLNMWVVCCMLWILNVVVVSVSKHHGRVMVVKYTFIQ